MRITTIVILTAALLTSTTGAGQGALTPEQASLERERRAQAAETERQRRQLEQEQQQTNLMLMQSQMAANQAKAGAAAAEAQWAGSAAALGVQSGMQGFKDGDALLQHNASKQLLMIQQAAMSYLATRRESGRSNFGQTELIDPFAEGTPPGINPAALPSCLSLDRSLDAIIVSAGCSSQVCGGRLQDGDVLLNPDGTPVHSNADAQRFLEACNQQAAGLVVFRRSLSDVVPVR